MFAADVNHFQHVDTMTWAFFPQYWPFVRESIGERSIPLQKPVVGSLDLFFISLNKLLNKQSREATDSRRLSLGFAVTNRMFSISTNAAIVLLYSCVYVAIAPV